MSTVLHPSPGGNGGSRESSEFEFVGKGTNLLVSNSEVTPTIDTLTSPLQHAEGPHLVSAVQSSPIMETDTVPAGSHGREKNVQLKPSTPTQSKEETIVATAESPTSSPGMFGWVKGGGLLSKVMEKTMSVTENVITTLDPQMREVIHSGGEVQIVVASDKEEKVGAIREAFQNVFGHATIVGLPSRSMTIAEQPVGFASGRQAALERISSLRKCGSVQKDTVVVSVENFLYEVSENLWLDLSCLILSDPHRKIQLQAFSQPTNVSADQIKVLKDSTPSDYPKQWSGFAVPIGGVMAKELNVSPAQWQEAVSGISRRKLLVLAGEGLAGMYKREIKAKVEDI